LLSLAALKLAVPTLPLLLLVPLSWLLLWLSLVVAVDVLLLIVILLAGVDLLVFLVPLLRLALWLLPLSRLEITRRGDGGSGATAAAAVLLPLPLVVVVAFLVEVRAVFMLPLLLLFCRLWLPLPRTMI